MDTDYTVTTWVGTSRSLNVSGLFCKEARNLKANLGGKTGKISYLNSIKVKLLAIVMKSILKRRRKKKYSS